MADKKFLEGLKSSAQKAVASMILQRISGNLTWHPSSLPCVPVCRRMKF